MTKINKEGWEIKKLTEVSTIQYGYAFDSKYFTDDSSQMPLIRIRDVVRGYSETFYNGEYPDSYIIKAGELLIGMDGEFNIARWQSRDALLNQRVCKITTASENLDEQYLYYFMKGSLKAIEDETPFVTVKHLSAKRLNQVSVNLPPLPIQQRIVEELDEINAIISAKKQQLSKLDELAQSIFYNMFGDPVANEMGWTCEEWNNVLKIINGKNQKAVEAPNGQYPICGSGGIMGYANDFLCPEHTIIIGRKGNINKPIYMKERFWNVDTAFGLVADNVRLLPTYLFYFCIEFNFEILNKAVTIPSLTKADLLKIRIPLPPLPLQEAFAARVSAIEEEKSSIAASIEKMQTLLDARMQEYFG